VIRLGANNVRRKVYVTAFRENRTLAAGRDLVSRYQSERFEIANSEGEADIILYLEYGYIGLTDLPGVVERIGKYPGAMHFLFSEADWPFPILPGAYPSLYKSFPWAISWCFLPRPSAGGNKNDAKKPQFLFSFLGRVMTHPVRGQLLGLNDEKSPCLDVGYAPSRFGNFDYKGTYFDLIASSKFILCPRGFGASSIRVFEAMSMGRVPVVISDEWQRPPRVAWEQCCVVVSESDISRIPNILRELEGEAQAMGRIAREEFEKFFAPCVFFDRLLTTLMVSYGGSEFDQASVLYRAWKALGWRECWTLASQAKAAILGSMQKSPV